MRRVLISAVIAKIFKYIVLATFWIPFRGTILEIILNEIGGNTNLVKSIVKALNNVTLPWLQEVSSLLNWITVHVQPISGWQVSIAWLPVIIGISSAATYFYNFPDSSFTVDMWNIVQRLGSIHTGIRSLFDTISLGLYSKVLYYLAIPIGGGWYCLTQAVSFIKDISIFSYNSLRHILWYLGGRNR